MCFTLSNVRAIGKWNWEGDEIIHSPIIRACRTVPGNGKPYDIDIREFLLTPKNEVVRRELIRLMEKLPVRNREFFRSRQPGSFDYRVREILSYISKRIRYGVKGKMSVEKRRFDAWLFPDELLEVREGDCEDRAFLLAAMLLAAGVSGYVVRVVLGRLYNVAKRESRDHVWVMYRNEEGHWICLEPLLLTRNAELLSRSDATRSAVESTDQYEYVPYYMFNGDHLWSVKGNTPDSPLIDYLAGRRFWDHFDPEFATMVHNELIDEALPDLSWIDRIYIKGISLSMDSVQTYDPRAHFDNGYIAEGWEELQGRLERTDRSLNNLAYMVHAAADFYAHTSYAHFARPDALGEIPLFDPVLAQELQVDYSAGDFDLNDTRFTMNTNLLGSTDRQRAVDYAGRLKIISGRFAQPDDPAQGTLEKHFVYIPYKMRHAADFSERGALPHHTEIAVDNRTTNNVIPSDHKLYRDSVTYDRQFDLRFRTAKRHIVSIYRKWKS